MVGETSVWSLVSSKTPGSRFLFDRIYATSIAVWLACLRTLCLLRSPHICQIVSYGLCPMMIFFLVLSPHCQPLLARGTRFMCSHPQTFSEKVGERSSLPRLLQCYSSPNPATLQRLNFWKRCAVVSRFLKHSWQTNLFGHPLIRPCTQIKTQISGLVIFFLCFFGVEFSFASRPGLLPSPFFPLLFSGFLELY